MTRALNDKGGANNRVHDRDASGVVDVVVTLKILDGEGDANSHEDKGESGPLLQRQLLVVNVEAVVRLQL